MFEEKMSQVPNSGWFNPILTQIKYIWPNTYGSPNIFIKNIRVKKKYDDMYLVFIYDLDYKMYNVLKNVNIE